MAEHDAPTVTDPSPRRWHKASYTHERGACVEVSEGPATGVRDSKHPQLGALFVPAPDWRSFIQGVKQNEF